MNDRRDAVWAKAREIDATLGATNYRFSNTVHLVFEDGSVFLFTNAFMLQADTDFLVVFSEHHWFHVYALDELITYSELQPLRGAHAFTLEEFK